MRGGGHQTRHGAIERTIIAWNVSAGSINPCICLLSSSWAPIETHAREKSCNVQCWPGLEHFRTLIANEVKPPAHHGPGHFRHARLA